MMTNPIPANLQAYEFTYRNTPRARVRTVVRFGATPAVAAAGWGMADAIDTYRHLGTAREYVAAQAAQS